MALIEPPRTPPRPIKHHPINTQRRIRYIDAYQNRRDRETVEQVAARVGISTRQGLNIRKELIEISKLAALHRVRKLKS